MALICKDCGCDDVGEEYKSLRDGIISHFMIADDDVISEKLTR